MQECGSCTWAGRQGQVLRAYTEGSELCPFPDRKPMRAVMDEDIKWRNKTHLGNIVITQTGYYFF